MFALNTRKLSTTLFISFAVLVAIATVAEANHDVQQRDHVNLKRIVRKRSPQILGGDGIPGPVIGAAPIPTGSNNTTTTSTASQTTSGATDSTTSGTATDTTSGTAPTDTTSSTSSTTSTSTTDSSTSTSTTESTSTTSSSTTTTPPPQVTSTTTSQIKSTKTVVTSVDASETSVPQLTSATAKTSSNIVTILVAVAASLGGVAILWTVFRKWKLGSSKRFEERMQPIDWRTPSHDDDHGLPSHRRNSGSSFNSRGDHSARTNNLSPLPDHDFTATGSVSPVGGYADMSRGPSPPMRENRAYEFGTGVGSGRY